MSYRAGKTISDMFNPTGSPSCLQIRTLRGNTAASHILWDLTSTLAFYYGFPVSEQWIIDLGIKEKLEIFGFQKSDTSETRELSLYHILTEVPSFLQKKSGIKSFTLLLRKIHTYVDGGKGYIITIRTNYFYKDGLVPTDDDVNKLRNILGKDENEKPKWYMGSLLREIQ